MAQMKWAYLPHPEECKFYSNFMVEEYLILVLQSIFISVSIYKCGIVSQSAVSRGMTK